VPDATRYLLDTNIISDALRNPDGRAAGHLRRVGEAAVCTSIVVAGELRYGAAKTTSTRIPERVEAALATMEVLPISPPVDQMYAELRARLERAGQIIGSNDLWIAAHALALDFTLVSDNGREFERVEGLRLENWRRDEHGSTRA
jgi:tRNA(fMet)-specific endonuclease VapC